MSTLLPIFMVVSVLGWGCGQNRETSVSPPATAMETAQPIPDTTVEASLVQFDPQTSIWTLNDRVYSGYVVKLHPDQTLKEKIGILDGKRENTSTSWYPDGHVKLVSVYHQGQLHGERKKWSEESNHVLTYHLNYSSGKPHGEQKQWYPTGELYKKMNLNMGQEDGLQQAFRRNGALFANYEAKNGRVFGLKKASLCFRVEDEAIQ